MDRVDIQKFLKRYEDVVLQLEKEDLIQFAKGSIEGNRKLDCSNRRTCFKDLSRIR